jgi:hypothetical protein
MTEGKRKEILHLISTWHEKDNPAKLRYNKLPENKEINDQITTIEKSMQITENDLKIVIY